MSMMFAFSGMVQVGIAASLLSLGAIDFGMIVDSSVVMVEICVRRLQGVQGSGFGVQGQQAMTVQSSASGPQPSTLNPQLSVIRDAAVEVRKPTMFGELIIMVVYLPILTLEGIEGKLFRPMALTVVFALAGSMVLSLTLMPVLASLFIRPSTPDSQPSIPLLMRIAHRIHSPILRLCMEHKWAVLGIVAGMLVVAFGMIAPYLGAEFVPRLSARKLPRKANSTATTSRPPSNRFFRTVSMT